MGKWIRSPMAPEIVGFYEHRGSAFYSLSQKMVFFSPKKSYYTVCRTLHLAAHHIFIILMPAPRALVYKLIQISEDAEPSPEPFNTRLKLENKVAQRH